ncbi:unnamed protein product [Rhizophagus irregularis]|uniref:MACPF domain-containing protein n=1 Tax=Rhizophagus irregularis TaxID=588596 RepID=A0A2N1NDA2_9GLOM|nr:hypothetical protein RhiirC2_865330 [Rhizophagus irregularis]CAB4378645.1 unnamed protein product [Rhizophagus irregularis]CAB5369942.1 unnamed protein product [Rhizophagus irregularis]
MSLFIRKLLNKNVDVSVQTGIQPSQSVLISLNLNNNLSDIRQILKQNSEIKMNDTLSFAKKTSRVNIDGTTDYVLSEIAGEDECEKILDNIIEKINDNIILYLIKNSKPNWKFLSEKCNLEYGRTIITLDGIKKAENKAFTMIDCEMAEIGAEGCRKERIEFNSNEDRIMKTELSFSGNIDVQDFVKFGVSISVSTSKSSRSKAETSSVCNFTEFGKVSLKLSEYLKPTPEFINVVEEAIKSNDPRGGFKRITEEFGQFIPTEVILGGRAYFKGVKISKESSEENVNKGTVSVATPASNIGLGHSSENSIGNANYSKHECFKLIGGEQPDSLEDFDEKAWVKSLLDFRNWDCIQLKDPISIFQLLDEELRKEIILCIGKRILHLSFEEINYQLEEPDRPKVIELNIPSNISDIIQNEDAKCNIFATVIDKKEVGNDYFSCQILFPPSGKPRLIIHCIQNKFKKRKCHLNIGWMVIGYYVNFKFILRDFDTRLETFSSRFNSLNKHFGTGFLEFKYNSTVDSISCLGIPLLSELKSSNRSSVIGHHFFNDEKNNRIGSYIFSYCLKNKNYVNLPDFTLCTLIISKYRTPNAYGILPFEENDIVESLGPKYISLHSKGENDCGPIFPKQKQKEIKIKYICKSKKLKNLRYAYFATDEFLV